MHPSLEPDPYETLNVSPDASPEEISAAYRTLARMYHPDTVASLAPEFREIAEERMKAINFAYEQIKNGGYGTAPVNSQAVADSPNAAEGIRPRRRRRRRRDYVQTIALTWAIVFACLLCVVLGAIVYVLNGTNGFFK